VHIFTGGNGCWADFSYVAHKGAHNVHLQMDVCMVSEFIFIKSEIVDDIKLEQHLGIAIHELLHILGAGHEHNRPDRNDFVTVNWQSVRLQQAPSFFRDQWLGDPEQLSRCSLEGKSEGADFGDCVSGRRRKAYGFPYDYYSIMHYNQRGYEAN
jgi:hypothetical protein